MSTIKKHQRNITWEEGSENVFADLGMLDAEEKLAKAKLAFKINEIMEKKRLKQNQAAELLGIDQSKISLLHCGHLKDFSVERLAHFLTLLDQDVDIIVKKKSHKKSGHGTLRVVYA
jgi:predicted XRE-type DNA-binding protein